MNLSVNNNFHRNIILSNIPISGYYRFENIFQISKGKISWSNQENTSLTETPSILEYDSNYYRDFKIINPNFKNKTIAEFQEPFRHFDFNKELLALLTLTGSANFYKNDKFKLDKKQLGDSYFKHGFIDSNLGSPIIKDNKNITEKYNYSSQLVNLPFNIDGFFTSYFNLNKDYLQKFRMSLMLYYNSIDIREYSPSMSYVALISSIENLVDFEGKVANIKYEKCDCGQYKYKVGKRFRDFMIKYSQMDNPKFVKYLKSVYQKRSNIAHLGELLYYDYAKAESDYSGENELNTLKMIVRIVLYNWIIENNIKT